MTNEQVKQLYPNIPPTDIESVLHTLCFDNRSFDAVLGDSTVQDRIYDTWQALQYVMHKYAIADIESFLKMIHNIENNSLHIRDREYNKRKSR